MLYTLGVCEISKIESSNKKKFNLDGENINLLGVFLSIQPQISHHILKILFFKLFYFHCNYVCL